MFVSILFYVYFNLVATFCPRTDVAKFFQRGFWVVSREGAAEVAAEGEAGSVSLSF